MDPLLGAAIGQGAIGMAGSIVGGVQAGKQRRKMEDWFTQQNNANESWYNANALSDYTQRSDTQALLRNMRNNLKRENRKSANSAVVTGATPELQAAQKEQSTNAMADTYGQIGAFGQQWKDRITDKYLMRKNELSGMQYNNMAGKANSYENLMTNGLNMMGSVPSTLLMGSYLGKNKKEE